MPRLKKVPAPQEEAANGTASTTTVPAAAVETFYAEPAGKRKGKAPSEKTMAIRAGLAAHPTLTPKALAALLNEQNPDLQGLRIKLYPSSRQFE